MNISLIRSFAFFLCFLIITGCFFSFELGSDNLIMAGKGRRTMAVIGGVYTAELWVPEDLKSKSSEEIIEADTSMAVRINIISRMINRRRFVNAVKEGFSNASDSGYKTDKDTLFISFFDDIKISRGDQINLYYIPEEGLKAEIIYSNNERTEILGNIPGLEFKKALFAIWLGPDPVQESLRNAMLGK